MRPQKLAERAHDTRPRCHLMSTFLENPCEYPHELDIVEFLDELFTRRLELLAYLLVKIS